MEPELEPEPEPEPDLLSTPAAPSPPPPASVEDEWAGVLTEFCLKHSYTVDPSALLEGRWQISTQLLCVPLTTRAPAPCFTRAR